MFRPFLLCFFSIRSHKFRGGTVVGWWGGTEIHAAAELCSSAEKYETQNAQLLENVKSRAHDKEHGVGLSRWEKESVTRRWSLDQPARKSLPAKGVWRVEVNDEEAAGVVWLRGRRGVAGVWVRGGAFGRGGGTTGEVEFCEFQHQAGVERRLGGGQRLTWLEFVEIGGVYSVRNCWWGFHQVIVLMMLDICCVLIPAAAVGKVQACHRCCHFSSSSSHFHSRQIHQMLDTLTHRCLRCGLEINVIASHHFIIGYCHHSDCHLNFNYNEWQTFPMCPHPFASHCSIGDQSLTNVKLEQFWMIMIHDQPIIEGIYQFWPAFNECKHQVEISQGSKFYQPQCLVNVKPWTHKSDQVINFSQMTIDHQHLICTFNQVCAIL